MKHDLARDDMGFELPSFIRRRVLAELDRDHTLTEADVAAHERKIMADLDTAAIGKAADAHARRRERE